MLVFDTTLESIKPKIGITKGNHQKKMNVICN